MIWALDVVRVHDGDTIIGELTREAVGDWHEVRPGYSVRLTAEHRKEAGRLRLRGINCPELSEEGGDEARLATIEWVTGGRAFTVDWGADDQYGRPLVAVWRDLDRVSLAEWLVVQGHAVWLPGAGVSV